MPLADDVHREEGEQDDKAGEQDVLDPFEPPVPWQLAQLFDKRDFVQQILNQAERAEPTADKPTDQRADDHQKSNDVKCEFVVPASERRLQRTDRTGAESAGTGITVEPWNAELLGFSGEYFSFDKADEVAVGEGGHSYLLSLIHI